MEDKSTNPKDKLGADKLPLHLWPETATALGSMAMLDGACKYGRTNYRPMGVLASVYYAAARRHLNAWFEGEDQPSDSLVPHLGHALACIAILIDARAANSLVDDRQYPGGYQKLVEELTPMVARIKAKYADRNPRHWTITDACDICGEGPECFCSAPVDQPSKPLTLVDVIPVAMSAQGDIRTESCVHDNCPACAVNLAVISLGCDEKQLREEFWSVAGTMSPLGPRASVELRNEYLVKMLEKLNENHPSS